LSALWEALVLCQVVEEQLDVRGEGRVRAVWRRREETEHLHGAVVPKVQIKLVPGDGDGCDRCSRLRNWPDASVAAKPEWMSAPRTVYSFTTQLTKS
jgi:hypothetical protein